MKPWWSIEPYSAADPFGDEYECSGCEGECEAAELGEVPEDGCCGECCSCAEQERLESLREDMEACCE